VEHIRAVAGIEHVGIGSDFDGIEDLPEGMHGVDGFPLLLQELLRRGWNDRDIKQLAGENLLRTLAAAEAAARSMQGEQPSTATVAALDGPAVNGPSSPRSP
jgi:membrane dipeptidase